MNGRATLYLILAVIGALAPLTLGGIFIGEHGLDLAELSDQLTENAAAAAVLADATVSSIVFWVWMSREAPRVGVRSWWTFVVANLLVGLSFALPLFLYYRERRLSASAA
ncbi:MAG: DUF2834 domain-containing protein [Thermoleophilaceae bacterium]